MSEQTTNGALRPSVSVLPWLMWGAAAGLYGFGQIARHSTSAMIDPLMRDFAVDATTLGLIASVFWYAYAALQLPGGFLLDRFGPARVLSGGAAAAGLGCLIFALAPGETVALVGRFLMGAGFATSYVGCLKSAGEWFPRHRYPTLVGFSVLAGMIGAILGQAPMAALVEVVGWRAVGFGFAVAAVPIALALWASGRARAPGLLPPPRTRELVRMLGEAARTPQVWIAGINNLGTTAPIVAFSLWGVAYYMQIYGLSRAEAATYTSTILLGWAIGSPIVGHISARLKRRKPVDLACALTGLMLWLLIVFVMPDLPRAVHYVLLFAVGLSSGLVSVSFSLAAEHGPARAPGVTSALINTLIMAGAALAQGVVGMMLDAHWTGEIVRGVRRYDEAAYDAAFLLLPAFSAVGALAALFVRETHGRLKTETKTEAVR
jgi:MFS family permease